MEGDLRAGLALALLLFHGTLYAGFPLSTEDAGTVGKGRIKLEVVLAHGEEQGSEAREIESVTELSLTYGVRNDLDISISMPYQWIRTEPMDGSRSSIEGIGDTQVSVKWRFFRHDRISWGIKAKLTYPSGDEAKNLGPGKSTQLINVFASVDTSPWAYLIDFGYRHSPNELGKRDDLWHFSAGTERSIGERWKFVADIGIDTNKNKAAKHHPAFSTVGFSWKLKDQVKLEGGIKLALTRPETDLTWLLGMNWQF